MAFIKYWEGRDRIFTDKQRVKTFTKLLASRERLAAYNEVGIKQTAGTKDYARTVKTRDSNLRSIERLKDKIAYYSAPEAERGIDA